MDELIQYVIYQRPKDHPEGYVVRRWRIGEQGLEAESFAWRVDTLEQARAVVPAGLYCLGRMPGDDPVILEVWT